MFNTRYPDSTLTAWNRLLVLDDIPVGQILLLILTFWSRVNGSGDLRSRFVVQAYQLPGVQRSHGVGSAVVITELHFVNTVREMLDHRANLATDQSKFRPILQERYYGEHVNLAHSDIIIHSNLSVAGSSVP